MTLSREQITENGIYVYSFGDTHSYVSCCLADGLEQLGVPVHSNIDYYEPTYSEHRVSASVQITNGDPAVAIIDLQHAPVQTFQPLEFVSSHPRSIILSMHATNRFVLEDD